MTNAHSQFTIHYSLFTILLLAFAFNLHALAADNLWEDEIFTAIFASRPPAEVIRWTANDIHPPLYYLLASTFTRLTIPLGAAPDQPTPASDWLWRFPSVIAGVLTIAITYRLASCVLRLTIYTSRLPVSSPASRRLFASHHIASSAALLLALAPIAIKYIQEARMHALFMCLAALSTWLFFRAMARPQSWSRWLAFALATTANIYTMYFGFLILATQAAFLLFTIYDIVPFGHLRFTLYALRFPFPVSRLTSPRLPASPASRRLLGFAASLGFAFLLYAPWWPVLFNILRRRAAVGAIEGGVGSPLTFVSGVVRALGPRPELVAWGFLFLFIVGLFFLARQNWPMAAFAALWLGLPVALPIFLGDPRALQFRYAFVLPIYLIVLAFAIAQISEWVNGRMSEWRMGEWRKGNHPSTFQPSNVLTYLLWILATLSFMATLDIYNQVKPDWRDAAAYLDAHTTPNDLILIGPLWDEGRFIDYYYRGQAQLLTPAVLVTNIQERAETLRATGGRVWAVNRFAPAGLDAVKNIPFPGVVVSEPQLAVYEPAVLTEVALNLARQAVDAAYPWAAEMEAQGVLNPDPRTAQAGALRALGDALVAAGRPSEALEPYQRAVDIFPGWVNGYITLAKTQEAVGNLAAAAEAYRQAVAFNLKWQGPEADEAAALVETGKWTAALEKYHQIIEAR